MATLVMLPLGLLFGFVGSRVVRLALGARPAAGPGRMAAIPPPSPASTRGSSVASAARSVGGALGQRRNVPLPQLQRAVFSEMIRHVGRDRSGRSVVPGSFVVLLNPEDHNRAVEAQRWFVGDLVGAVQRAAKDNGWTLEGPTRIDLRADLSRRPGSPAVEVGRTAPPAPAQVPAAAPPAPAPVPARREARSGPATLVRSDEGGSQERYPLAQDQVTIGRGADRDIRVPEARASRNHGSLRRTASGWVFIDDASSNGTLVNGSPATAHQPIALGNGDRIEIGRAAFRLEIAEAPAPPPPAEDQPTGLLSASDREDLTGQYFPPE